MLSRIRQRINAANLFARRREQVRATPEMLTAQRHICPLDDPSLREFLAMFEYIAILQPDYTQNGVSVSEMLSLLRDELARRGIRPS